MNSCNIQGSFKKKKTAMATGDVSNNLEKLKQELRSIRYQTPALESSEALQG